MEEKHKIELSNLAQTLQDQYQSQIRDFLQNHFNSALSALSSPNAPEARTGQSGTILPQPAQQSTSRTPAIHLRRSSSPVSNFSKPPSNLEDISRIESQASSVNPKSPVQTRGKVLRQGSFCRWKIGFPFGQFLDFARRVFLTYTVEGPFLHPFYCRGPFVRGLFCTVFAPPE